MKISKFITKINSFYPETLAEDWDNVGLQLGDKEKEINSVLTALEITDEIIDEAIEKEIDMIITHHPLIFKPLKNLSENKFDSKNIIKLIKNNIAVYSMHTNVDIAANGMNDWLSEIIGIQKTKILKIQVQEFCSLVSIEIDPLNINRVIEVLNINKIGKSLFNEENIWIAPKIKRFRKNYSNKSKEKDIAIIEVIVTKEQEKLVYKVLKDLKFGEKINSTLLIQKVENKKQSIGIGRYGHIKTKNLEELVKNIQDRFCQKHIKFVGNREQLISKVAVVGGSGSEYLDDAIARDCDVLITGDIGYHTAIKAQESGICLIDPGHYMEIIFNDAMAQFLTLFEGLNVYASKVDIDPFQTL